MNNIVLELFIIYFLCVFFLNILNIIYRIIRYIEIYLSILIIMFIKICNFV